MSKKQIFKISEKEIRTMQLKYFNELGEWLSEDEIKKIAEQLFIKLNT